MKDGCDQRTHQFCPTATKSGAWTPMKLWVRKMDNQSNAQRHFLNPEYPQGQRWMFIMYIISLAGVGVAGALWLKEGILHIYEPIPVFHDDMFPS